MSLKILEQLAEGQAEQLFEKARELAQAGDVACLRMILDRRIWPPRKAHPINVTLPPINSPQDALPAIAAICTKLREGGRLTPDEITARSSVVGPLHSDYRAAQTMKGALQP